tara:strand:- start:744 stop:935 length:192 start_codon:yes stop_codon:yes gene_type:complete
VDPKSKEYLDKILEKNLEELTEDEKSFLRARRSYLKRADLEEYKGVLNQTSKKEPVKKKNGKA